jgi:hypothetical protein
LPHGFFETARTTFFIHVDIGMSGLPLRMKGARIASGSVGLLRSLFLTSVAAAGDME